MVLAATLAASCSDGEAISEVSGVVVEVESSGLTEVESFKLRSDDRSYEFFVTDETDLAFPPAHLNEHRVSGEPVAVVFERKDHGLYALSIDDACLELPESRTELFGRECSLELRRDLSLPVDHENPGFTLQPPFEDGFDRLQL